MTPGQIDNSVSVSCDVAAVTCFFCPGFNGCASKVAQNISNKPYLTLPSDTYFYTATMLLRAKHNIATYDLEFAEDATIQNLGEKILELTGVPISGQKLICSGRQLTKDMAVTLAEVWLSLVNDRIYFPLMV